MDGNGIPQQGMYGFGMLPNHPWGSEGVMPPGSVNMNHVPPQQMMGGPVLG